jgi:hypothetical protein
MAEARTVGEKARFGMANWIAVEAVKLYRDGQFKVTPGFRDRYQKRRKFL